MSPASTAASPSAFAGSPPTVTSTDTGILIEGTKPTGKPVQCLAPMTSVAVVLVDESVVG